MSKRRSTIRVKFLYESFCGWEPYQVFQNADEHGHKFFVRSRTGIWRYAHTLNYSEFIESEEVENDCVFQILDDKGNVISSEGNKSKEKLRFLCDRKIWLMELRKQFKGIYFCKSGFEDWIRKQMDVTAFGAIKNINDFNVLSEEEILTYKYINCRCSIIQVRKQHKSFNIEWVEYWGKTELGDFLCLGWCSAKLANCKGKKFLKLWDLLNLKICFEYKRIFATVIILFYVFAILLSLFLSFAG